MILHLHLLPNNGRFCSGHLKRMRDTLLPLLEHAIADLNEFLRKLEYELACIPIQHLEWLFRGITDVRRCGIQRGGSAEG